MALVARHEVGRASDGPGDIARLAIAIAIAAKRAGLRLASVKSSRHRSSLSRSKYIELVDEQGHLWLIRVSNHHRPGSSWHAKPHFDLVTHDGVSGLDQAECWIAQIASCEIEWVDHKATEHPPARRRRKRVARQRKKKWNSR